MKTKIIFLAVLPIIFTSCIKVKSDVEGFRIFGNSIEGKGPIQQKNYDGDFDQIEVSSSIHGDIVQSNEEKIVISAPSNILEYVLVENHGGKVHIHYKSGINIINGGNVKATIYARDFTKLSANSSGSINIKDQFTQDKTDIEVSSSGEISGNLEANTMNIEVSSSGEFSGKIWAVNLTSDVSSSGEVSVYGKTKVANIQASSSGSFNAADLVAENAVLDASSSGDIELGVLNSLQASANSSGDIKVKKKGNLQMNQVKESSGGSVTVL